LMESRDLYKPTQLLAVKAQIRSLSVTWGGVFLLLAGAVFALKIGKEFSRGATLSFAGLGLGALIVQRIFWHDLLMKGLVQRKFAGRNIVLITDRSSATESGLIRTLTRHGFRLDRHFVLPDQPGNSKYREEVIARAIAHIRGSEIQEIVVGADLNRWPELSGLLAKLRILPLPVNFIPVGATSEILRRPLHAIGSAISIELQRGPLSTFERAIKRVVDILCAGTGLIVLLPLLTVTAIAIKLDSPGPILFRQRRRGFNGKPFQILKFRTMHVLEDDNSVVQAAPSDSRVTALGKWLRRTSIDELPQLLNVLSGSMSLVGPRPHALAHDTEFDKAVRNYAFRHHVKPGLTGWAQANGYRGPTPTLADVERRVELDLWYIDNWSLTLDFAIILRTAFEILRGHNAY
jgi:Undecaprenyl-phosphate glucose phosphotransferase